MARKSDNAVAIMVGLVLVGIAMRGAKRGAKPSAFKAWSDADARAFIEQLSPLGVPLDALLQVYAAESGLDPAASSGISWGLCQAIESTLKGVGWLTDHRAKDFGQLSVAKQAPWIAKVLASQIRMIGYTPTNALDLYEANFSPLAARNHADIIYRAPSQNYQKNRQLDKTGAAPKGYIDRADLALALEHARASRPYIETSAQLRRLLPAKAS